MLRPHGSRNSAAISAPVSPRGELASAAQLSPRLSAVPSIDTEQFMDVYETEIDNALTRMGIAGAPSLRENQASVITHALHNENLFLALATGAGKSLCFHIPALIQARHQAQVTVVIQPTLGMISNQVRALSTHGVDVEIISSLTTSKEKNDLAVWLNRDGSHLHRL